MTMPMTSGHHRALPRSAISSSYPGHLLFLSFSVNDYAGSHGPWIQHADPTEPDMEHDWDAPKLAVLNSNKVLPMFYVYAFEGLVLFLFNGSLAFCIARHSVLRQRYTVQLAQITVDSLMGLALLCAGFGRLIIVSTGSVSVKTRQFCALMPWNILSVWTEPMSAVCLLMVSIDRLLALLVPIAYFKRNRLFQDVQVASWNIFMWSIVAVNWYFTFSSDQVEVSPFCWTSHSVVPLFASILLVIAISASVSSVVTYVAVFIISRKHATRVRQLQKNQQAMTVFAQRQRRLTATMGLSCIFTLVLYVLPLCLKFTLYRSLPVHYSNILSIYAAISVDLNPLSNIIIILLRHDDISERYIAMMPSFVRALIQRFRQVKFAKMPLTISNAKPSTRS